MDFELELKEKIRDIDSVDSEKMREAYGYIDSLIKPPKSLGKLEKIAISLAGITGKVKNTLKKKRIIVLCADNGVTCEGVSSAPVSVTASQAVNMTKGIRALYVS